MARTTKRSLLKRAIELAGRHHVAKGLGVQQEELEAWIRGDGVPDAKLRPLADFLNKLADAGRQSQ
jgi:hypothetical protein